MKKLIITFIVILLLSNCSVQKEAEQFNKISQEKFLEMPFGFEENIKNFTNQLQPKFKTQKLLRKNAHYPEKTDTIYRFYYKKSEVFFYKTHLGKEFLIAGKIINNQVNLVNGIHVGIPKSSFTERFSDRLEFSGDSLQMTGEGTKYTFIFKKDKLHRINIDNYFD
jgi:hypothetical protein